MGPPSTGGRSNSPSTNQSRKMNIRSALSCFSSLPISGMMPQLSQMPRKNRNKNTSAAADLVRDVSTAMARKKKNFVRGSRRCRRESLSTYCK